MSKVRTLISAYSAENFKFLWNSNLVLLHKRSLYSFFHHYCDILIVIIGWFSLIMLRPTPWRMLQEFHLIDFAFMSAEHDVSAKPLSRKVPTKRHAVSYKLSRWDASDSHLISLTLLYVNSSRRAQAHSINLHFPSLPPYYNILVFLFKMYSCGREYIYTWIGVYVYTWIQLEALILWWVSGLYRFAFLQTR